MERISLLAFSVSLAELLASTLAALLTEKLPVARV